MPDRAEQAVDQAVVALHGAIDEVRRAYKETGAAIDAIPDPQQALDVATKFSEDVASELREVSRIGLGIAYRQVVRIRDAEQLSLSALAARLSVSKSRAHQIVEAGKESTRGSDDTHS